MLRLFSVMFIISLAFQAKALGNCTEAAEPGCTSLEETYKSKEAYAACTAELENMSKGAKEYIECLKKELQETADKVQKEADELTDKTNNIIKKFNCRADPNATC